MKKYLFVFIAIFSITSCKSPNSEAEQYLFHIHNIIEPVYTQLNYCMANLRAISENDHVELNDLSNREIQRISKSIDSLQILCGIAISKLEKIGPFEGNIALVSHYNTTLENFNQSFVKLLNEFITNWNEDKVNYHFEKTFEESLILITTSEIERIDVLKKYKNDYHLKPERLKLWIKKRKAKFTLAFLKQNSYETSCIEGDCIDGFGKSKDIDGSVYTGYFKDGLFHGKGTLEYSDGELYIGEFNMGKFDGYGVYEWNDGNTYKGEWKNTDCNGHGTMIWANGDSTKGIWKNGKIVKEELR